MSGYPASCPWVSLFHGKLLPYQLVGHPPPFWKNPSFARPSLVWCIKAELWLFQRPHHKRKEDLPWHPAKTSSEFHWDPEFVMILGPSRCWMFPAPSTWTRHLLSVYTSLIIGTPMFPFAYSPMPTVCSTPPLCQSEPLTRHLVELPLQKDESHSSHEHHSLWKDYVSSLHILSSNPLGFGSIVEPQ